MAKVIKRKELALPVYEMNNGSVAEVVSWPPDDEFIGSVIQRRGDDIIIIGKSNYYPDFFNADDAKLEKFTVRLLTEGTLIEL